MYNLNLLPPKMRKKRNKSIKINNPTYAPFLLAAVIVVSFLLNHDLNNKIKDANEQIEDSKVQISKVEEQLNGISTITNRVNDLREQINKISNLLKGTNQWAFILDEISSVTPPETTINAIQDDGNGIIKISATTFSLANMARMKAAMLNNNKFSNVDISDFKYKESNFKNRPNEIEFIIMMKMNQGEVN